MSVRWSGVSGIALAAALVAAGSGVFAGPGDPAVARAFDDKALAWGPCPEFMPKGCGIAVLHGDPAKPNADVFFRVPGKAVIPSHWHTSPERMVLVSGEMTVAYEGQPMATLRPGNYAYGPAKAPHAATCTSATPCVLFIAFEGPVDAVPSGAPAR
jgi:quercetin dioxygenase-like cupin family protein